MMKKLDMLYEGIVLKELSTYLLTLENRTFVGTETVQIKEENNKIYLRKSWRNIDNAKWEITKFNTMKDAERTLYNQGFKTSNEWDKIEKEKQAKIKKQLPLINEITKINSDIKRMESKMKGGRIDSLNKDDKKIYDDLLNQLRIKKQQLSRIESLYTLYEKI